jgi:hypothetical protein
MPIIAGTRQDITGVPMMCAKPDAVTWVNDRTNCRIYRIPGTFQPAILGEPARSAECSGET